MKNNIKRMKSLSEFEMYSVIEVSDIRTIRDDMIKDFEREKGRVKSEESVDVLDWVIECLQDKFDVEECV